MCKVLTTGHKVLQVGHTSDLDEIWILLIKAIHLDEFGQSGQLSNLKALRVTVERPLYTTFTVLKHCNKSL